LEEVNHYDCKFLINVYSNVFFLSLFKGWKNFFLSMIFAYWRIFLLMINCLSQLIYGGLLVQIWMIHIIWILIVSWLLVPLQGLLLVVLLLRCLFAIIFGKSLKLLKGSFGKEGTIFLPLQLWRIQTVNPHEYLC
jgi:hypothetical protein